MVLNPDNAPEVVAAREWEARARARAFLDLPYEIAGVEVSPLSLHRLGILEIGRNAFLCGGAVTPEAVTVFLWVLSPGFRIGDTDARAAFIARLREAGTLDDLPGCTREITEFLDEMFLDSPVAEIGGKSAKAVTSPEAVYGELFAEACGWSVEQTMHAPLPQLYQVLRRITLRKDPEARFFNRRSDRARREWMDAQETVQPLT